MRVYPAHARKIAALRARGIRPAFLGVLLSSRWDLFDAAPKVCIHPDEWARGRWEFGFLRDEFCAAIWGYGVEAAQFGELLFELMCVGPRLLWAVAADGKWLYQGESPEELADYGKRLGAPSVFDFALARERYQQAQLAALAEERIELDRAIRAGRTRIGYLERQRHALDLARRLFSDPWHAPNDLAA